MTQRTVDEWEKVLGDLPSPEGESAEKTIADHILASLSGYRTRHRGRTGAPKVMQAYARMMFDAKVRP